MIIPRTKSFSIALIAVCLCGLNACQTTQVHKHQYSERLEHYHQEMERHKLTYSDYCTLAVGLVREAAVAEEHGECKE